MLLTSNNDTRHSITEETTVDDGPHSALPVVVSSVSGVDVSIIIMKNQAFCHSFVA